MWQAKHMNLKSRETLAKAFAVISLSLATLLPALAFARDIQYGGSEQAVYVRPGEPTQISFPGPIEGGFKRKQSAVALEKQDTYLVLFAQPQLSPDGEAIIVHLEDKRTYSLRVLPATEDRPRDGFVNIIDSRDPEIDLESSPDKVQKPTGFAPPSLVSGLVREMVLVAEFGKKKGITGYRRSNSYSGETIIHDGAIKADVDEIFMGSDLWGYVVNVENLLGTTQRVNPATFRLDGTRAISAQRWELAPKPVTAEQEAAQAHKMKLYIVTKAKRR